MIDKESNNDLRDAHEYCADKLTDEQKRYCEDMIDE